LNATAPLRPEAREAMGLRWIWSATRPPSMPKGAR
jgi:hypothetical protein